MLFLIGALWEIRDGQSYVASYFIVLLSNLNLMLETQGNVNQILLNSIPEESKVWK